MAQLQRISPLWIVFLGCVWWSQASPRADSWVAGAVAVLAGAALHVGLGGRSDVRLDPRGLASFVPFLIGRMIAGGIDVSRRAFSPSLPLAPDVVRHPIRLPAGLARVVFIDTISLLPGSFSARVGDDEVLVHRLDDELAPEEALDALETKVGELFGITLGAEVET